MTRRRTKIIATLGPVTDDDDVLRQMIQAGVNVCRINLSHGSHDDQRRRAAQARRLSQELNLEVGLLADLKGPKIRIEKFASSPIQLKTGDSFALDAAMGDTVGDQHRVGVSYAGLPDDVDSGDMLLLDDGLISMRVTSVEDRKVHCEVVNGGALADRKGLNLQGGGLSVPGLAEDDLVDIPHAAGLDIDYLAVSFPRNADDMNRARQLLRDAGSEAGLAAKIERTEAIDNLASIIDASDAVLVARGDLGVEIGDAELPGLQKRIIDMALRQNRVVITATQMMQSMVENPIPTRAEVLDVANAVIDGSDAVMLSAETAIGKYPVKVVESMHRVCLGAERHSAQFQPSDNLNVRFQRIDQAIAMAAMFTANNIPIQAIVALTESGSTARWLSRVRSTVPIFALSPNARSRRQMALFRDVYPVEHSVTPNLSAAAVTDEALKHLYGAGLVGIGDRVIFTMGDQMGMRGGTNTMKVLQVGDEGSPEYQSELGR